MAYAESRVRIIESSLEMIQKQGNTTHQDRCKVWIRDLAKQVYSRHPWDAIRVEQELDITDGTSEYALTPSIWKVFDIVNESNVPLRQVSFADLDAAKGLQTVSGNTYDADPLMYELRIKAIHTALPTTGTYSIVAAAGDDAEITIVGLDTNGVMIEESQDLNADTPVNFTAAFEEIKSINKNEDTTGDIVVKRGTTEIAKLYLTETETKHYWVNFFFTPGADATFTVIGIIYPPLIADDNDVILIPGVGPYMRDILLIDVYREDGQIDKSREMEVKAWRNIDKFFGKLNPKTTKFKPPQYRKFG